MQKKVKNMMIRTNNIFNDVCKDAVVFARVSSQEQELGASIDAQLKSVFDYCEQKNLNIVKKICFNRIFNSW